MISAASTVVECSDDENILILEDEGGDDDIYSTEGLYRDKT